MTNYHVLDENYLSQNKELKIYLWRAKTSEREQDDDKNKLDQSLEEHPIYQEEKLTQEERKHYMEEESITSTKIIKQKIWIIKLVI